MRVSACHAHATQAPSSLLPLTTAQSCAVCDPSTAEGAEPPTPHPPLQTQGLLNSQPGLRAGGWTPPSPALLQSSEMLQGNLTRAPATSSLSPWSGRSQNEPLNCLVLFFKENHVFTLMPKLQRLTARQLLLAEPAAAELLSPGPFYVSGARGGGCFKERSAEWGFAAGHPEAPSLRSRRHRGSLLQSPTPVCFWLELEPGRAQLVGTLPAAVASAP